MIVRRLFHHWLSAARCGKEMKPCRPREVPKGISGNMLVQVEGYISCYWSDILNVTLSCYWYPQCNNSEQANSQPQQKSRLLPRLSQGIPENPLVFRSMLHQQFNMLLLTSWFYCISTITRPPSVPWFVPQKLNLTAKLDWLTSSRKSETMPTAAGSQGIPGNLLARSCKLRSPSTSSGNRSQCQGWMASPTCAQS